MVTDKSTITYAIELTHGDKGIAFSARDALKRSATSPSGYVVQARFREEPSSGRSVIMVSLREDRNDAYLREVLEKSHSIPSSVSWHIESIRKEESPTAREGALQAKLTALEERQQQTRTDLEQARDENARLKRRLETAGKVSSPLEGVLAYFEQLQLEATKVIDDDFDLRYLRKVLAGESPDTFIQYVNFGRETLLAEEEIQELEQFDYTAASKDLEDLGKQVEEARELLGFLQGIEERKVAIPAAIKQSTIDSIRSREPEKTISRYEELQGSTEHKRDRHLTISGQRQRYNSLSGHLRLLEEASEVIPVIFNFANGAVDIYFPFQSKKVKPAFMGDLTQELRSSYALNGGDVEALDHKFLAYKIQNPSDIVERMVVAVPFTLRIAGFHKIARYQLGG